MTRAGYVEVEFDRTCYYRKRHRRFEPCSTQHGVILYPTSSEKLSFANAPLVQISVELGWDVDATDNHLEVRPSIPAYLGGDQGDATSSLRKALAEIGYTRSTREYPEGFPVQAGRALITWDAIDELEPVEVRSGIGYFGVAGLPPYKSWLSFQPRVEEAISALLRSLDQESELADFTTVTLRYIDAFRSDLTEGWSPSSFVSEVLGFKIAIPSVITESVASKETSPGVFINMQTDLNDGSQLNLAVGEASVNGGDAVVLDMAITAKKPVTAGIDAVMRELESAHNHIREYFVTMIRPIAGRLGGSHDEDD